MKWYKLRNTPTNIWTLTHTQCSLICHTNYLLAVSNPKYQLAFYKCVSLCHRRTSNPLVRRKRERGNHCFPKIFHCWKASLAFLASTNWTKLRIGLINRRYTLAADNASTIKKKQLEKGVHLYLWMSLLLFCPFFGATSSHFNCIMSVSHQMERQPNGEGVNQRLKDVENTFQHSTTTNFNYGYLLLLLSLAMVYWIEISAT